MEEFFEISMSYITVCNLIIYIMHTMILKVTDFYVHIYWN